MAHHVVLFAVVLALYSRTIQRGIPGGDSGELVAEACHFGVPHPPGYPLWLLLNNLAIQLGSSLFPSSTPALITNQLSCIFGALAAVGISMSISLLATHHGVLWLPSAFGSFVGGLLYSVSSLQWLYSVGSEVFALNNCLCAWTVYLFMIYGTRASTTMARNRVILLGAFLSGLCLSNQHTSIFFLIPIVLSILYDTTVRRKELTWILFLQLLLAGIMGLLPYIVLYREKVSRGSWGDTSTLTGLVTHMLRREYGTFSLSPSEFDSEGMVERSVSYLTDTRKDIGGWAGYGLAALGCLHAVLRHDVPTRSASLASVQYLAFTVFGCFLFYVVIFHSLSNLPLSSPMPYEVHRRFWMQPNIVISFFIGMGVCYTCSNFQLYVSGKFSGQRGIIQQHFIVGLSSKKLTVHWLQRLFLAAQLACFFFFLANVCSHSVTTYFNMIAMNGPDGEYVQQYGSVSLTSAAASGGSGGSSGMSLVISSTDINWNSMRYLQTCQGQHLSTVVHVSLQIAPFPWFPRQQHLYREVVWPLILPDASMSKGTPGHTRLLSRFLRSNLNSNKFQNGIYLDLNSVNHNDVDENNVWKDQYQFLPHGLLWRVEKASSFNPERFMDWKERSAAAHAALQKFVLHQPAPHVMFPGSWEEAAFHIAVDGMYQRALFEVSYAVTLAGPGWIMKKKASLKARQTYELALSDGYSILKNITQCFDNVNATSLSLVENDVRKNFALTSSRLALWYATINENDPRINAIAIVATKAVDALLQLFPQDESNQVFQQILPYLKRIEKPSSPLETTGSKQEAQTKASKKKKKVKKKKKGKRERKRETERNQH